MFRSTVQISFSELYMECSIRRSQFFKGLNTSDPVESRWRKK
ncbi:MAG: hypothetical protein ACMUEL_01225 [Flavobacteriales bacterium Tduv]